MRIKIITISAVALLCFTASFSQLYVGYNLINHGSFSKSASILQYDFDRDID